MSQILRDNTLRVGKGVLGDQMRHHAFAGSLCFLIRPIQSGACQLQRNKLITIQQYILLYGL